MSVGEEQDCEVKFNINNILRAIREDLFLLLRRDYLKRRVATRCKVVNPFTSRLEALRDVPSLLYGGQTIKSLRTYIFAMNERDTIDSGIRSGNFEPEFTALSVVHARNWICNIIKEICLAVTISQDEHSLTAAR